MCDQVDSFGFYGLPVAKKSNTWYLELCPEERVFYSTIYKIIVHELNVEQVFNYVVVKWATNISNLSFGK